MKKSDLTTIGLRLIGIYYMIQSVILLQSFIYVIGLPRTEETFGGPTMLSTLVPGIVLFLIALILVLQSKWLAELITPQSSDEVITTHYSLRDLQAVLISSVGVFIFANTLSRIFIEAGTLIRLTQSPWNQVPTTPKLVRDSWFALIGALIQSIAGILLFFYGKVVNSWWHRLRESTPSM